MIYKEGEKNIQEERNIQEYTGKLRLCREKETYREAKNECIGKMRRI